MDHNVRPVPAPINASVTLPRVLLKNEPGELGAPAGCPPWLRRIVPPSPRRGFGETSTWRLAGDRRVRVPSALAAAGPPPAPRTAAPPRATATPGGGGGRRPVQRPPVNPPLFPWGPSPKKFVTPKH